MYNKVFYTHIRNRGLHVVHAYFHFSSDPILQLRIYELTPQILTLVAAYTRGQFSVDNIIAIDYCERLSLTSMHARCHLTRLGTILQTESFCG